MNLQEMFWKIIYTCLERYSKDLTRKLAGGILTSEERIRIREKKITRKALLFLWID